MQYRRLGKTELSASTIGISTVIPGIKSLLQLEMNAGAGGIAL
jgi:aryl-alcohol dehydrogenase-like predicted oxidoreductase